MVNLDVEGIIKLADKRPLNSDELLRLKSRTYYPAIKLLEISKGKNESSKEFFVRTGYNIFRELDECEDVPVEKKGEKTDKDIQNERTVMMNRVAYICGEIVKREYGLGRSIEDIIHGDDFRSVTNWLVANEPDKTGKIFAEHFGKGAVLRDFYELGRKVPEGKEIQEALDYSVKSMSSGMSIFIRRGPIETFRQLDEYCDHVAGDVGKKFLNPLVKILDRDENGKEINLSEHLAEQFAKYLQLTNIIKNVRSDYNEGRRFFPGEWIHREISFESMMDGDSFNSSEVRKEVLDKMASFAEDKFKDSVRYIQEIPQNLSGYRAFSLLPLIAAQKTLENVRESSSERVFNGEESAVKITHGIRNIYDFSSKVVKNREEGKEVNIWLEEYSNNPSKFSFKPGEYESWSDEWLK